ncbi:MAG: polysaccharide pyruvyl transferase family protein [Kiritimatiellae bacterium]|nr:polysaccharide pyruvyl transferase family protein [Kiritimatiellia bacterium]
MTHACEHRLCYAAMGSDELRAVSSSGGAFTILARWILSQGGVVYGAAFNERMECRYEGVADESGLSRLRGSKYVKAELAREVIEGVRRRLADGVPVLFVGVPCQVAAVKNLCKDDLRNLYTIDLVCNGTPAREMFRRYLDDNWGADNVAGFEFRNKSRGWRFGHALLHVRLRDGREEWRDSADDEYMQAFSRKYSLQDGCFNCRFCNLSRPGDLTLCDFWKCDASWDDGRGTSAIIENSTKGAAMLSGAADAFARLGKIDLQQLCRHQPRLRQAFVKEPGHEVFRQKLSSGVPFKDALDETLAEAGRNVAVLNFHWETVNFGAVLTAYALNRGLRDLGFRVWNIDFKPDLPRVDKKPPNARFDAFRRRHLPQTQCVAGGAGFQSLNSRFGSFVVGSDQVWNPDLVGWYRDVYFLMFAHPDKRIVSAAASFGTAPSAAWGRGALARVMRSFDKVTVREASAAEHLASCGVDADVVADPVFLLDQEAWLSLAATACAPGCDADIVVYAVNPFGKKGLAAYCGKRAAEIAPRLRWLDASDTSIEEWLAAVSRASLVVTDSFHAVCFALIFERPFAALVSANAKSARLREFLRALGLEDRIFESPEALPSAEELGRPVDYGRVRTRIADMRHGLADAMKAALERPVSVDAARIAARRRAVKAVRFREVCALVRRWCGALFAFAKIGVKLAVGKDVGRNLADASARNRELCGRKSAIRRMNAYLKGLRAWKT